MTKARNKKYWIETQEYGFIGQEKLDMLLFWYQNFCDWVEVKDMKIYNECGEYADSIEAERELSDEELFEDGELNLEQAEEKLEMLFKNNEISELCYNNHKARF